MSDRKAAERVLAENEAHGGPPSGEVMAELIDLAADKGVSDLMGSILAQQHRDAEFRFDQATGMYYGTLAELSVVRDRITAILDQTPFGGTTADYEHVLSRISDALWPSSEVINAERRRLENS